VRRIVDATLIVGALAGAAALVETYRASAWLFADGRLSVAMFYLSLEGLLIALCLGAFLLGPAGRAQVAAGLVAAIVAVFAANAYITFEPVADKRVDLDRAAALRGHPADQRSQYRVIRELRERGIDAVPSASPPNFYRHDPRTDQLSSIAAVNGQEALPLSMSVSNSVTVACNENGQWLIYRSDERGFRNPPGLWAKRPIDIVLLGDSFGYGSCEEDGADIAGPIRRRVPATLNLSASGGGGLSMLAYLNEYLFDLKPRHVVWLFFEGNDMQNIAEDLRMPLLRRYFDDRAFKIGLADRQDEVDAAARLLVERFLAGGEAPSPTFRWRSLLFLGPLRKALDLPPITARWTRPTAKDLRIAELERAVGIMKASVESWGGTLHFAYLPAWYRGRSAAHSTELLDRIYGETLALLGRLGMTPIDLVPVFKAAPEPERLVSYPASHYNDRGYRLVADAVLARLLAVDPAIIANPTRSP
jgi:hypothetical protein